MHGVLVHTFCRGRLSGLIVSVCENDIPDQQILETPWLDFLGVVHMSVENRYRSFFGTVFF